jgi:hypothetical protein
MATKPNVNERVAVLETKLDDVKEDINTMRKENKEDHATVISKLERLEGYRNWLMGAFAIVTPVLIILAEKYLK